MRTLIFDNETTGLVKNTVQRIERQPHVIEFYGLVLDDALEEVDHLGTFFSHHKPLEADIKRITGIADSDLAGAPTFLSKAEEVKNFIESCDAVVAHNLTYDMTMIDFEMKRASVKLKWPKERICTVEQTEFYKGFRLNLQGLHEFLFGEGFANAHRAENDVRALAKCFIELKKRGDL